MTRQKHWVTRSLPSYKKSLKIQHQPFFSWKDKNELVLNDMLGYDIMATTRKVKFQDKHVYSEQQVPSTEAHSHAGPRLSVPVIHPTAHGHARPRQATPECAHDPPPRSLASADL